MLRFLILMCALIVSAQAFDLANPKPPVAAEKPKDVTVHEGKRMDDYFWLREKGNVAMEFNSPGMYRALRFSDRPAMVAIYGDEAKN